MSSHARLAGGVALASTLTVAIALVLRLVTPSLTFGDGYGFLDGQSYGAMARSLRTGEHFDILSPYAFRVLPAALVAWSGLDYRLGYLLLNMFGYVVAGGALYGLLVATGARARVALLLVAWWAVLPAGVRLSEYYPVLVDGVGAAFLMALLWAAVAGSILACALLLAAGALVRENLIVLTPMVGLLTPGRNAVSAARRALLVVAPAAAVLLWVRMSPPIPAANGSSTLEDAARNLGWFFQNADERALRFAAAPAVTLGMLVALPLLHPRRAARYMRAHPAWAYYLVVTLALAPAGGGDFDRFAVLLAPALAVLTANVATIGAPRGVAYTVLHVGAVRALLPVGPDEASYRAYNVATMDPAAITTLAATTLALWVLAFVVGRVAAGFGAHRLAAR